MSSKQRQAEDSRSRKNVRIPEILEKSREKERQKYLKQAYNDSIQYGTDSKKQSNSHSYVGELQDLKAVIQSCDSCMEKISQFTTKKPVNHTQSLHHEKSTQTSNKPFLINLIEERVTELCRQNRKLSKILLQKQAELIDKSNQINEIEDKFTQILYTLGQDLSELRSVKNDADLMHRNIKTDNETPSYLKALLMESNGQ